MKIIIGLPSLQLFERRTKNKWQARALAALTLTTGSLFGDVPCDMPSGMEADAAGEWQSLASNFNALVFGNFTAAGGDCEYRLAVGGTATFTMGYSVGQPVYGLPLPTYTNAETDILIVGGDLYDGWFGVNGNIVYGGTRYGPFRWMPDGNVVTQISPVAFDLSGNVSRGGGGESWTQLFSRVCSLSTAMAAMPDSGVVAKDFSSPWQRFLTGTNTALNVFNVNASDWNMNASQTVIDAPAGATVLVNIYGGPVAITNCSIALVGVDQRQVLYNYVDAAFISTKSFPHPGSVLAPFASAALSGGAVNGTAVFGGDVTTSIGFEFHNFPFAGQVSGGGPVNQPPVVHAGPDIILPVNGSVQLSGWVGDDGQPVPSQLAALWEVASGSAAHVTFDDPAATNATAAFSAGGEFTLRLNGSDGTLTAHDTVSVTVVAPSKQPPFVTAGPDRVLDAVGALMLAGFVSDDGKPEPAALNVRWRVVAGDADAVSFGDSSLTNASAAFAAPGDYILRLTAADGAAAAYDDLRVSVRFPNEVPAVEAGPDFEAVVGTRTLLQGSVTDDDQPSTGMLVAQWSVVSGDAASVELDDSAAPGSAVRVTDVGTFKLRLTASDGELTASDTVSVTVVAVPNLPPTVHAGPPQEIALYAACRLLGGAEDDGLPAPAALSLLWEQTAGPGAAVISDVSQARPAVSFPAAGVYAFRLTASDGDLNASAETSVSVSLANQPPQVNAGEDFEMTGCLLALLRGQVTDDGLPLNAVSCSQWALLSGPGLAAFESPDKTVSPVTVTADGEYVFRLTACDGEHTVVDDVAVSFGTSTNLAPVVDAGADQTLDFNLVRTANLVVNPGGETAATNGVVPGWTAPGAAWQTVASNIAGFAAAEGVGMLRPDACAASELWQEVDVSLFAGTIDDNRQLFEFSAHCRVKEQIRYDEPRVMVEYRDSAGALLAVTDISPTPISSSWGLLADTRVAPAGTRAVRIRLRAENSGIDAANDVYFDAVALCAVELAGVTLAGSVTDDGLPSGGSLTSDWRMVSGPVAAIIDNSASLSPAIFFSAPGVYELALLADDGELGSEDRVTVTVVDDGSGLPLCVDAGTNQVVRLPLALAQLQGAVENAGTNALTVSWTEVSGHARVFIENADTLTPSVRFYELGEYTLRLSVSDGVQAAYDEVRVEVAAPEMLMPMDVVMVIDCSGSMEGGRIVGARLAAQQFVENLKSFDRVAVVAFNSTAFLLEELTFNHQAAADEIIPIIAYGGTAVDQGVAVAANHLLACGRTDADWAIVLLSDGGSDYATAITEAQAAHASGIRILSVGLGTGTDERLMSDVASSRGDYFFAPNANDLEPLYESLSRSFCRFDDADMLHVYSGPPLHLPGTGTVVELQGRVSHDLASMSYYSVSSEWSVVSAPAVVWVEDSSSPVTSARFAEPGTYVLALTGRVFADGVLAYARTRPLKVVIDQPSFSHAPEGLAALWQGEGSAMDSIANFHGVEPCCLEYTNAPVVQGFCFDRAAGGVAVATGGGLDVGASTNGFTVGFWAHIDSYSTDQVLAGWYDAAGVQFAVIKRASSSRYFQISVCDAEGVVKTVYTSYYLYTVGAWQHFVFTYEPSDGSLRIYRDGVFFQKLDLPASGFSTDGDFYIGADSDGSRKLQGALDEIAVFRRALTPDEIWSLYRVPETGMVLSSPNECPAVDAGPDSALFSIGDSLTLSGFASDDGLPLGSVLRTGWRVLSGPGAAVFADASALNTTVSFNVPGVYTLELSADDSLAGARDTVRVTVACTADFCLPPPGLRAHWPAEGTGREVVSGFDAAPVGAVCYTQSVVGAGFDHGGDGLMLARTGGGLDVGRSTDGFTIEFWTRIDSSSADQVLAGWYDTGGLQFAVIKRGAFYRYFQIYARDAQGTYTSIITDNFTYVLGQWHHFAFAYEPSDGSLTTYRDGVFFQTLALSAGGFPTPGDFCIGGRTGSAVALAGATDEVSVYDRCLRPDEVWMLYESPRGKAVMEANLPPAVAAGPDRALFSANEVLALSGSVTDDGFPLGCGLKTQWRVLSGPGEVTFADPAASDTTVSFSAPGSYVLELAADDGVAVSRDTLRVTVACSADFCLPPSGLRAHWPAEGTGREVVSGFDAYPVGAISYAPGAIGTGFEHHGNSMMLARTGGGLDVGSSTNGFTLEFWTRIVVSYERELAGWFDTSGLQFGVMDAGSSSRYLRISVRDAEGTVHSVLTANYIYALGVWHHFAFTYEPSDGSLRIYRDGLFLQTLAMPAGGFPTDGDFGIGRRTGAVSSMLFGATDEVSVYDRALSAAEIQAVFQAGAGGKTVIPANQPPDVFAGYDRALLDTLSCGLSGIVSDDGCPTNAILTTEWTQLSGPGTAQILTPASLSSEVAFPDYGTYRFRLTVSDGEFTRMSDVSVTLATSVPANIPPAVDAGQPVEITLPAQLALNGSASDPDAGPGPLTVAWSCAVGPAEVIFEDAASPVTTAVFSHPGNYVLRLSANDGAATALSHVAVVVHPYLANAAPAAYAGDDFTAARWTTVTLAGSASDDGVPSPLTYAWSLVSGPAAVPFSDPAAPDTRVQFTQPGTYVLMLTAFDGEKQGSDTVTATVYTSANQPPAADAGGPLAAVFGAPLELLPAVTDDGLPDGWISYGWRYDSGSGGCALSRDDQTGLVSATFSRVGAHTLLLTATDGEHTVADTLTVNVTAPGRDGPSIAIVAPEPGAQAPAGGALTIMTDASEPQGSLAEVAFYANGQHLGTRTNAPWGLTWQNLPAGTQALHAVAMNEIGQQTASAPVVIRLQPVPPGVSLLLPEDGSTLSVGTPFIMQAAPVGGAAVESVEFLVNGSSAAACAAPPYVAVHQFAAAGIFQLQARALLAGGGTLLSAPVSVTAAVPAQDEVTLTLDTPAHGGTVTAPTDITGSLAGGDVAAYTLQARACADDPADPASWRTLADGAAPLGAPGAPAVLGSLDPTLLRNGEYELRVIAQDLFGGVTTFSGHTVIVEGAMKVGHFQLAFEDLNIPLAGIPVQLLRAYDSRGGTACDFGPDWELGFRSVQVHTAEPVGIGWEDYVTRTVMGIPFYGIRPVRRHVVSVLIGEDVQQFEVYSPTEQGFFQLENASVAFRPINGSVGALTLSSADTGNMFIVRDGNNEAQLVSMATFDPFDPAEWVYTAPDGTRLDIRKVSGLFRLTDRNANSLTFTRDGITHSSGESVAFTRDAADRVTAVTAPGGVTLGYSYDSYGYLSAFVNRAGETNRFEYVPHPADPGRRLLHAITDPLGNRALAAGYDADGRLVSQTDASGNAVTFGHDIPNRRQTVSDRLGHATVHEYDLRGNIVRTVDALGNATLRAYDEFDNEVSVTDPLGNTTTRSYDANRNKLTETDALGHTTSYTYANDNQPLTITDARGNMTAFAYDANGNVMSMADAAGGTTIFTYDGAGNMLSMTDALGNRTEHVYDWRGRVVTTTVIGVTGDVAQVSSFTYDSRGNQSVRVTSRTIYDVAGQCAGTEILTNRYEYDQGGRLIKNIHPDGSYTETEYNAAGKETKTTDALGLVTSHEYDDNGNRIQTEHPDGSSTLWTFDAEGRQLTETRCDANGNIIGASATTYDALGRKAAVIRADALNGQGQPEGPAEITEYDAAGRVTATYDGRGNVARQEYDPASGSVTAPARVIDALGNVTHYAYDANGNRITVTDALGNTVTTEYDAQNRPARVTHPDGTFTETVYDAAGRRSAVIDELGRRTDYAYDARGRMVEVVQPAPTPQEPRPVTRYAYDEAGNRIAQTDALGRVTRYQYDCMGRRVSRTLPGGQTETLLYGTDGLLASKTDFNGRAVTRVYDALGRLTEERADPGHPSLALPHAACRVTHAYDAAGRRCLSRVWNADDGLLHEERLGYDLRGRVVEDADTYGTLSYAYDDAGNLTAVASDTPGGVRLAYEYDALNRLGAVHDLRDPSNPLEHGYAYTPVGSLDAVLYANGVAHTYDYNGRNRLTGLQISDAQSALLNAFS
jgi:choice-of-anchor A domain-containing protein